MYYDAESAATVSPIKPNRTKKPRSFRRANHAELKFPPWAKPCCLVRRSAAHFFLAHSGYFRLVRHRSLGSRGNGFYPQFLEIRGLQGKIPAFHLVFAIETGGITALDTWLGLAYFPQKCPCPGTGTKGFASICLWYFVLRLINTKSTRAS